MDAYIQCPACLGIEHLRGALVDPCPECDLMYFEVIGNKYLGKEYVFSYFHCPTPLKIPFSARHISSQSFQPLSFSPDLHTVHSGSTGTTSTRGHADPSILGRLAVVRQIASTSGQQYTASVTSCCYLGLEGKPSEKLPNPKQVSVLSGHALELQVNESNSHRWQKAGTVEDLSEVPGSLQTALYQLPTTGRPFSQRPHQLSSWAFWIFVHSNAGW